MNTERHTVDIKASGSHVSKLARKIQTVKERVRAHVHSLPFVICKIMIIFCVMFCVSRVNLQASTPVTDSVTRMYGRFYTGIPYTV